jgi:hypothetical protein
VLEVPEPAASDADEGDASEPGFIFRRKKKKR